MGIYRILSVPLYWWPKKYLWGNSSRHRKITKTVILFKKLISVLSSLLNVFTFYSNLHLFLIHTLNYSDLLLNCHSWSGQLAQINKALSEENQNKDHRQVCQRMKINVNSVGVSSGANCYRKRFLSLFSFPISLPPPSLPWSFFLTFFLFLFIFLLVYVEWEKKIIKGLLFPHSQFPLALPNSISTKNYKPKSWQSLPGLCELF